MRPIELVMLCPAGFEDLVADAAKRELPKFVEDHRSGGYLQGRSVAPVGLLRSFPCATNTFSALCDVPRSTTELELRALCTRLSDAERPIGLPQRGSIRLRVHDDGRFAPTGERAAKALEHRLSSWSGLPVRRVGASVEIWLLRRRHEPRSVLATKLSGGARRRERGVLRPEICASLARVEPLRGARLVLDPFAGSGAIGEACLAAGAEAVWLNDLDARRTSTARIRWTRDDVDRLVVPAGGVDAIVTDPPWGHYAATPGGIEALYARFGEGAASWLKPGGAVVALTGAPDGAVRALVDAGGLSLEMDHPVLVSGRKARVIRARSDPARGPLVSEGH